MGHLSFLFMIIEYFKYSHLGLIQALDREIPFYNGQGQGDKVQEIQKVSYNFYFFATCLISMCVLMAAGVMKLSGYQPPYLEGFYIVPFLLMAYMFVTYYRVILRSHHQFSLLSRLNLLSALVEVTACVGLVMIWGIQGVILGLTLTFLLGGIYIRKKSMLRFPLHLKWIKFRELRRLLKIGIPLILYDSLRMVFLSVDKIMIIALLGYTQLGLYSVATMAFNFLMPLPKSIFNVIAPRFYEAFGKTENIESMKKYLIEPTIVVGYLFSILIGIGVIFLIPMIFHILPQYRDGIQAVTILLISSFFYSIIFMWGFFLIAMHKQMKMVYFNLIAVILSIGLNLFFVKGLHWGIAGIAVGTSITYAVLSTIFITYVYSFYTNSIKDHLKLLLQCYFPAFWGGVLLWGILRIKGFSHVSLITDLIEASGFSIIFFACCLPLVLYVNNRSRLFEMLFQMMKQRAKVPEAG